MKRESLPFNFEVSSPRLLSEDLIYKKHLGIRVRSKIIIFFVLIIFILVIVLLFVIIMYLFKSFSKKNYFLPTLSRITDSSLLDSDSINKIENFLKFKFSLLLIYKASEDKCDRDMFETIYLSALKDEKFLLLIKSSAGKVFGGYCDDANRRSFIFSVSSNEKIKSNSPEETFFKISESEEFIFQVGKGDITLSNNCLHNEQSSTFPTDAYDYRNRFSKGLSEDGYFQVEEVEIFSLNSYK